MTGFCIQELRARGKGMPDAIVKFESGFSLLTGPSDTGKSFVADAINHVFGASGHLRSLTEQSGYDQLLVEIRAYEAATVYTLARAWGGGAIELFEASAEEVSGTMQIGQVLRDTHDQSTGSVSGFLLSLSGLLLKQLRKNEFGEKVSLSFRNLKPYTLVDEERIITKHSPFLSGQVTDRTKELSLFKLVLTGQDDAAIVPAPDVKTRKGLEIGRREAFDSLISDVRGRIADSGWTEKTLRAELESVEESVVNYTAFLRAATADIEERQERRKALWRRRQGLDAKLEQARELLERFTLLDSHYAADISRLESTQESGKLLVQLSEGPCPLCGADPVDHRHEGMLKSDELDRLGAACEAEERKLRLLVSELQATLAGLKDESDSISREISALDSEMNAIQIEITTQLEPGVRMSREGLEALLNRRRDLERTLALFDELRRLESTRARFEIVSKKEAEKRTFAKAPIHATDDLAVLIGDVLTAWNYPNVDRVIFDPEANDIAINGKLRASHGKGYRAITYAAFMVGVMLYCRQKRLPHPGFVILDSPLVTYRKPDKQDSEDDKISEGMVPPFYDYLSNLPDDCQVIVIENVPPPDEAVLSRSTHTHFTRNTGLGRFGFLYPPAPENPQA